MTDKEEMQQHTAESLMASALLKIRSDSLSHPNETPIRNHSVAPMQSSNHFVGPINVTTPSPCDGPQATVGNSALLNSGFARQPNLSFEMVAALRAATGGVAPGYNRQAAAAPTSVSLLNLLSRSPNSSLGMLAPVGATMAAPTVAVTTDLSSLTPSNQELMEHRDSEADNVLRKEKVEEALRSKPQRGRKREDLSEIERLELTRTRNREHAKSTRQRKKARYQELLDCEEKLKEVEEVDRFNDCRKRTIMNFLHTRERLMKSGHDESAVKGRDTFGSEDIIEDLKKFKFSCNLSEIAKEKHEGVEKLIWHDRILVSRVVKLFGPTVVPALKFNIKGGESTIALSSADIAFVEIEFVLENHPNDYLITGVLRLDFVQNSHKLKAANWMVTDDAIDDTVDQLNEQVSHPSVISLEPSHSTEMSSQKHLLLNQQNLTSRKDDEGNGPGMSI